MLSSRLAVSVPLLGKKDCPASLILGPVSVALIVLLTDSGTATDVGNDETRT